MVQLVKKKHHHKSISLNGAKRNILKNVAWYIKLALSFFLVFGTWNPLQYDIVHTLMGMDMKNLLVWFLIVLLIVIWGIAIKALQEALGTFGIVVFLILAGLLIGGLYQSGFINIENMDAMGWYANIIMTMLIFFGLMFPTWWRQLTGKVTVDDDMG